RARGRGGHPGRRPAAATRPELASRDRSARVLNAERSFDTTFPTPPPWGTLRPVKWTSETVPIAGVTLRLNRAGSGAPVLVLQHDVGTPPGLPFYDTLARDATVLRPAHPGYDGSERPTWLRNVGDIAAVSHALV